MDRTRVAQGSGLESGAGPVLGAHHDRPRDRFVHGQERLGPLARGEKVLGGEGLEPVAQRDQGAQRQPDGGSIQGR